MHIPHRVGDVYRTLNAETLISGVLPLRDKAAIGWVGWLLLLSAVRSVSVVTGDKGGW